MKLIYEGSLKNLLKNLYKRNTQIKKPLLNSIFITRELPSNEIVVVKGRVLGDVILLISGTIHDYYAFLSCQLLLDYHSIAV